MRRLRKILFWLVVVDLAATLLFWVGTRFMDQTRAVSGGTGVVFYTDNSRDAAARIAKAVNLLRAGKLERLYMVGGHRPQDGWSGSQEMALIAARGSGLGGRISADVESRDTISGIQNLARDAKQREPGELVFVSNCMQLMRAKAIYDLQPDHQPKVLGVCPPGDLNPLDIWRRAHYEAGAWALLALPEAWQDKVLDRLRGADENESAG
ncbi:MAG TPA: ElyC/SanA/YdcF family protein [Hyphomonas sp.]|nr:YdcF family protein [Hyphomonas sp.]MCB9972108.1 YdcF family protein [Hyphomonas sp.]HPE47701.1 ElyC/SanA/YdcF family protein [Hyphomonas sp.]